MNKFEQVSSLLSPGGGQGQGPVRGDWGPVQEGVVTGAVYRGPVQ